MINLVTHQPCPPRFKENSYRREYHIDFPEQQLWAWLNDPKTFTDHQVWPFKVEFVLTPGQTQAFEQGVFNAHHGPLMSFSGVIGEVTPHYRDLTYLYGSYFLSMRLVRPHRLQFWTERRDGRTILTLQLDSYVYSGMEGAWNWAMKIFWRRFGKWANQSIRKRNL